MDEWLGILRDESLTDSFTKNVDLLFGNDSTVEEVLDDVRFRRIFQSVCYLRDIEKDVDVDIISLIEMDPEAVVCPSLMMGRMKNTLLNGITKIRDYVVNKYPHFFKTSGRILSLEARIFNKLTAKDNYIVFCLHCETSFSDSQWVMGARCSNCTGWWILHSLEESIDDDVEDEVRGIDFEDMIAKIMKSRLNLIEEEIMDLFPLKVVVPYVPGNTINCGSCDNNFGNSLAWETVDCKLQKPDTPPHWVCFKCGYFHMMTQLQNQVPIRCYIGCGPYDSSGFLAMCGNRMVIDFIRIYGRSYEIRYLREYQPDN